MKIGETGRKDSFDETWSDKIQATARLTIVSVINGLLHVSTSTKLLINRYSLPRRLVENYLELFI
jgi:hypothetical protein